ncbi:MAG TPA: bifunctional riboflavin kinase/FAD synthetase [Nitrospirota bacterium]|nr:bifunctional riboflavin kinase/FAD synthetase [Nitrospirota bacterium]
MRVIRNFRNLHERFTNPVLTLGNFDGVHLGHQAIFKKVISRAREIGGVSIAFTFEPHPLKVVAPERSPRLLNTFHAKMKLLEAAGIEIVMIAHFTRAFADQHPEDFARTVLHESIGVREVYVGYDYAFGRGREGSIESLKAMGRTFGFAVGVVEAVRVGDSVVSSSVIRDFLSSGAVSEAYAFLGRYYTIEGEVVHGAQRGKGLGFPTANLKTPNELIPGIGVYAVRVSLEGRSLRGVASIGIRPTFDSGPMSVEIYLLDFSGDIYGKQMEVAFIKRLRGEEKFTDADALVRQIRKDVHEAELVLRENQ